MRSCGWEGEGGGGGGEKGRAGVERYWFTLTLFSIVCRNHRPLQKWRLQLPRASWHLQRTATPKKRRSRVPQKYVSIFEMLFLCLLPFFLFFILMLIALQKKSASARKSATPAKSKAADKKEEKEDKEDKEDMEEGEEEEEGESEVKKPSSKVKWFVFVKWWICFVLCFVFFLFFFLFFCFFFFWHFGYHSSHEGEPLHSPKAATRRRNCPPTMTTVMMLTQTLRWPKTRNQRCALIWIHHVSFHRFVQNNWHTVLIILISFFFLKKKIPPSATRTQTCFDCLQLGRQKQEEENWQWRGRRGAGKCTKVGLWHWHSGQLTTTARQFACQGREKKKKLSSSRNLSIAIVVQICPQHLMAWRWFRSPLLHLLQLPHQQEESESRMQHLRHLQPNRSTILLNLRWDDVYKSCK